MELSKISVFMSKPDRDFDDLLNRENYIKIRNKNKIIRKELNVDGYDCKVLYINKNIEPKGDPDWLEFINQKLEDENKISAIQKSIRPSGLLLVKMKNRIFASCFGTSGTSFIDKSNFEKDFGIKVAMNSCDVEQISQTKSSKRSYNSQLIYRVNSIPGEQYEFGLSEMEFLDYLSANIESMDGVSLHGKDNLTIKSDSENKFDWDKFLKMLGKFISDYTSVKYKERFPNYAILEPVSVEKADELDEVLISKIKKEEFDKLHLSLPDIIDDEKYTFIYGNPYKERGVRKFSFIEAEHLKVKKKNNAIFNTEKNITIKKIKDLRIFGYDEENNYIDKNKSWTLYDCIVCEIVENGHCYVLFSGEWRMVDNEFYSDLNNYLEKYIQEEKEIDQSFCDINIFNDKDGCCYEKIFNEEVAKRSKDCFMFDRSKFRIGKGAKNNEFCDLFFDKDDYGEIVHVKRESGSSSLNHLFSQARFYCEAFLTDEVLLNEIRGKINKNKDEGKDIDSFIRHFPDDVDDIKRNRFDVLLWILYDNLKEKPEVSKMNLMSKYELKMCYDLLKRKFGYRKVIISFVPVGEVNLSRKIKIEKQ